MSDPNGIDGASELENRCAWLGAMGIPLWLPREPLPGGPDVQTSWRRKAGAQQPAGSAVHRHRMATGKPDRPEALNPSAHAQRKQHVAALLETVSSPESSVSTRQGSQKPAANPAGRTAHRVVSDARIERPIRIDVDVRVGGGWLLLAEHGTGFWGELERLFLADLMFACSADAQASQNGPTFHWPPSERDRLASRGDLARDALGGFIEKCAADREIHSILCLGSSLSDWLIQAPAQDRIALRGVASAVRRVALPGVRDLLAQPASKRHVWHTLSELAHGT